MKTQSELDDLALLLAELSDAEREDVLATAERFRIAARQNAKDLLTEFVDGMSGDRD